MDGHIQVPSHKPVRDDIDASEPREPLNTVQHVRAHSIKQSRGPLPATIRVAPGRRKPKTGSSTVLLVLGGMLLVPQYGGAIPPLKLTCTGFKNLL